MDIKLIALDMDGTLLDEDHSTVPARNLAALRAAAEQGVAVAIASGRVWKLLTNVAAQLPMVRYAILSNGASVLDTWTGEWLHRKGMPQAQGLALIRLLLERGYLFEVYYADDNYVQANQVAAISARLFTREFQLMFEHNSIQVENLLTALADKRIEKFNIFHVPPEERADFLAQAQATGPLAVTCSYQENMELAAEGVNKGAALQALCRRLDIPAQAVMAFGDAGNDLEMLSWAGYSFAMANATEEAKAAARYQTGANHEGGVGMAVEQYVLKQAPKGVPKARQI